MRRKTAAEAGVSPEVTISTETSACMGRPILKATTHVARPLFRENAQARPTRARANALRQLQHQWKDSFKFRFEPFDMIDNYLKILGRQIPRCRWI